MQIPVELLRRYKDENPLPIKDIESRLEEIKKKKVVELDGAEKVAKRRRMISSVATEDIGKLS